MMNGKIAFLHDFKVLIFSPKTFFSLRFSKLGEGRIFALGFFGVCLGLAIGNALTVGFLNGAIVQVEASNQGYLSAMESLGLNSTDFIELLRLQRAYSLLLLLFSPLIAYFAPHIFAGSLFVMLWLMWKPQELKLSFNRIMECASLALSFMIFYIIPLFGPLLAPILVGINLSRILNVQYKIVGILKIMCILSAMYVSFLISSTTLQMLARPFADFLSGQ